MFEQDKKQRVHLYSEIHDNLSLNSKSYGISSLRRLEIRYMPLDPLLVTHITNALQKNVILQELILTNDALTYSSANNFLGLFSTLKQKNKSSLTLLDFSSNFKLDSDGVFHDQLI